MKLSDFNYTLPKDLIAQFPLRQRDKSRMLVLDKKSGKITHKTFSDLPDYLTASDAIVLNDTKVFKARLIGKRTGNTGKIELLLLNEFTPGVFKCLAKPAKKLKIATELEFADGKVKAAIVRTAPPALYVRFNKKNLHPILKKIGLMPLPPYIKRAPQKDDEIRYQSVYAKKTGAIAAPTAGLHFTKPIISKIRKNKTKIVYLTLHVGYGTFKPVTSYDVEEHKMHSEVFEISEKSADEINKIKQKKGRVLAVGTTTCRALESAASLYATRYTLYAKTSDTDLFIYPGYQFKITDMLLTNFHLPKTTLLMLACAFGGYNNVMRAYCEAIKEKYRFYSYGDCMLVK